MENAFQSQTPYQNWIHLKPELENNKNLIAIVKDSIREQRRFKDAPNYIGSGESNIILRIGELQVNGDIYNLAFRTNHCIEYERETYGSYDSTAIFDIARFDQIAEKIAEEKDNYIQSQKFFGLVKWDIGYGYNRFGIILEDLTKGGKYKVVARDYETAAVYDNEKEIGRYFIDPLLSPDKEERAKKYLDSAIDLGDFLKKS